MKYLDIPIQKIKSLRDYFDEHPEHADVTDLNCYGNQLTSLLVREKKIK